MDNPHHVLTSVLDRMVKAGWVSGYGIQDGRGFLIQWTDAGTAATKQLRHLFDQLGPELFGDELTTLLVILDTMSPGGIPGSDKNRV
jgi:hypothetical protein